MPDLVQLMKQAALDAVEVGKPVNIVYGTVVSAAPLKIQIDQKLTLGPQFLVLTRNVVDYDVEMVVNHTTEQAGTHIHSHAYQGTKTFRVLNGLKMGEKVIMVRMQGGQRYVVLDKVVNG